jgi:hypothetical protein
MASPGALKRISRIRLRGTNTGVGRDGSAPTGRKFTFKGASIVHVEGDKIRSDYAYFYRKSD